MSFVLVIGASKGIGLETVKQALAAGHRVRALSRSAAAPSLQHERLERFTGDALVARDVRAALEGVDAVVQTLGIRHGEMFRPVTLFSDATRVLIAAMQAQGVRRLISVTGFGAGDSQASIGVLQRLPFRLVFGHAYDDKSRQERLIRDSGLDWTLVRPGVLTNGPRSGRYRVLEQRAEWRNGIISRADVADYLVRQIDDAAGIGKTPVLVR
jgi:putative NADH-flavin reductase